MILQTPNLHRTEVQPYQTLPIGPKVVPFGGFILEFYKVIPKKGTTLGPMGKPDAEESAVKSYAGAHDPVISRAEPSELGVT